MNRRPFIKQIFQITSGVAIASQFPFLQSCMNTTPGKKLGIALVGLGSYSTNQLGPALLQTKHCYLAGIVTGTKSKEAKWIKKYNIKPENVYNYTNFDDIAKNKDIDIVYVVLPNSMHAEYTIRAAKAGKHVICEKPMAISVAECQQMIAACKTENRKLSIGYRLYFDPYTNQLMQIAQNRIQREMSVSTSFSFELKDPKRWRTQKSMAGGGPLMDIGVYCIQGCIYTFGELPTSVWAKNITKDNSFFKDIEGTIEWELTFPSGKAYCKTSYEEPYFDQLIAKTGHGDIKMQPAYTYDTIRGETWEGTMTFEHKNQQAGQMDAFALDVLQDRQTIVPGEMGLRDNFIIEKIYQSAANNGMEVSLEGIPDIQVLRPLKD